MTPDGPSTSAPDRWACLDLGSNSFQLVVAERQHGEFFEVERLKQKVQLLSGFADGQIEASAFARGIDSLKVFAQRLAGLPVARIRAVGTCALRMADNQAEFLAQAQDVLGVPVEVVSGEEEARLVDLAVAYHVESPSPDQQRVRMVIDVGGGSTELAYSQAGKEQHNLTQAFSLNMGCVAFRDRFFTPAELMPRTFAQAKLAALQMAERAGIGPVEADEVLGTSGTVESIEDVLIANAWSAEGISRDGLAELELALTDRRWINDVGLPGLAPERVDIFPAGVAIVSALLAATGVGRMHHVPCTLLEGKLLEAAGVPLSGAIRNRSVSALQRRHGVDEAQAMRVQQRLALLLTQVEASGLELEPETKSLIFHAAALHQLGLSVSPGSYHRHGSYLISHAKLRGFSRKAREALALLVRGHRRSFPALAFRATGSFRQRELLSAVILLRLAVILERGHDDARSPRHVELFVNDDCWTLRLPGEWIAANALSANELAMEIRQLATAGIQLRMEELSA